MWVSKRGKHSMTPRSVEVVPLTGRGRTGLEDGKGDAFSSGLAELEVSVGHQIGHRAI